MERLTERDEFGNVDIIALSDMMPELYAELSFSETNALTEALNRLAAYEDTGLEPEEVTAIKHALMGRETAKIAEFDGIPVKRLQELAQAEKDGRLVVLPCKVGDTVYRVITTRDNDPIVTEIEIKTLGQAADLIGRIGKKQLLVSWYLTREEAEAALKKREANNEAD